MENKNSYIDEIIKRTENFRIDNFPLPFNNNASFEKFLNTKNKTENSIKNMDYKFAAINATRHIYLFDDCYDILEKYGSENLYGNIGRSFSFVALCFFLNKSKKIKGQSLTSYTYETSPSGYNDPKSSYYFASGAIPSDYVSQDAATLRKRRHRILSSRPVYDKKGIQWNAVSPDANHEWLLLDILTSSDDIYLSKIGSYYEFSLEQMKIAQDTCKRLRVLTNPIASGFHHRYKFESTEQIQKDINAYNSRLNKLKYENYLILLKLFLKHLKQDPQHYGINLYRLEFELNAYYRSQTMALLDYYWSDSAKRFTIQQYSTFQGIPFSPVREELFYTPYIQPSTFHYFLDYYVPQCILILDEFIEKGYFGTNWEKLFYEITNELANDILFNPDNIDYTVYPESQKGFIKLLSAETLSWEHRTFLNTRNIELPSAISFYTW